VAIDGDKVNFVICEDILDSFKDTFTPSPITPVKQLSEM
jgi:hypothetical protein